MKDHEIILKMIEEVDPSDTAKLDEIDAKVELYNLEISIARDENNRRFYVLNKGTAYESKCYVAEPQQYTRSRDALKAIRPEGWFYNIGHNESNSGGLFACSMYSHTNSPLKNSPDLPTEELAELHAIIQAIAYEREMK